MLPIHTPNGKNVVGLEVFASYKWIWNDFFVKTEFNYIAANVPTHQYDTDGTNSYDATYNLPSLNLLVLAGYQSKCLVCKERLNFNSVN